MTTPLSVTPGSLPHPRTRLIGRERECADAHVILLHDAVPLLTLTGPGGVGKTRVALAVARAVADHVADGVVWVDLAPLADPAQVPSTIARALGITPTGNELVELLVARHLQARQSLLLLDNCEHLVGAVADLVAPLLASCPRLQVLTTSRVPLRLQGEHLLAVAPLPVPVTPDAPGGHALAGNPAMALFVDRARAADIGFRVDDETLGVVAEICSLVEGLPLALELAAARLRVLPLTSLRDRLQSRLSLLAGGPRDAPARQRTVRDTIDWSYTLLPAPEQALVRQLAVFVGGCSLQAVEAVVASLDPPQVDALPAVTALLDSSLMSRAPDHAGAPRYRMLETVREFALEHLAASGDEVLARDVHAASILALAEQAAPTTLGGNPVTWLHHLANDHENLHTALRWLCRGDTPQACLQLAGACGWYWYRWGHVREGRAWLDHAIADAGPEPTAALGRALYFAAELATRAGDPEPAADLAHRALAVWDRLGDATGRALALHALARAEQHRGHWDAAASLYDEELPIWRETGNPRAIGMVLVELAEVAFGQGDLPQAQATMREAAGHFRQVDEGTWLAATELYLGLFAAAEGKFAAAARHYRTCLAGYMDAGDAFLQSPLAGLALMAVTANLPTTAAMLLGAADRELQRTGMRFDRFEQPGRDQAEAHVRAALDAAAFAAAYARGRERHPATWLAAVDEIVARLEAGVAAQAVRDIASSSGLTPREWDVLALVAEGQSDQDVATALCVTTGTVRTHLTSIFSKLDVGSRTAAVAAARRLGLL